MLRAEAVNCDAVQSAGIGENEAVRFKSQFDSHALGPRRQVAMHQGIRNELAQGFKRELRNIANVAILRLDRDTAHVCPQPRHRRGQETWDRSVQRGDIGRTDPRVNISDVGRANDELGKMLLRVNAQRENSRSREFTGGGGDSGPAKAFGTSEYSNRRPSNPHLLSPRSE